MIIIVSVTLRKLSEISSLKSGALAEIHSSGRLNNNQRCVSISMTIPRFCFLCLCLCWSRAPPPRSLSRAQSALNECSRATNSIWRQAKCRANVTYESKLFGVLIFVFIAILHLIYVQNANVCSILETSCPAEVKQVRMARGKMRMVVSKVV